MSFIAHFRDSAPYIHAYRGKTLVVWLRDQAVNRDLLQSIASDLTLMNSLGLKIAVVFDADCFDQPLSATQPVSDEQLATLTSAVGRRRYLMEGLFSQGLANSPMHGAKMRVLSGNYVMARPAGVFDGVDLMAQGRVRRIDHLAINEQLSKQQLVLLPPLGYSVTGEILYLPPEQLVVSLAKELSAHKVMIVGNDPHTMTGGEKELTPQTLNALLESAKPTDSGYLELSTAAQVSQAGIARCHVVNAQVDGALLTELFTRDGIGTLIALDQYDTFRPAHIDDLQGILSLLKPLEEQRVLIKRDPEKLQSELHHYFIHERDGMIIGCAAVYPLSKSQAELACVVVHPDYQQRGRGDALLGVAERHAKQQSFDDLFVLTTQTAHWFEERGFREVSRDSLPTARREKYNERRNSKVYLKHLS